MGTFQRFPLAGRERVGESLSAIYPGAAAKRQLFGFSQSKDYCRYHSEKITTVVAFLKHSYEDDTARPPRSKISVYILRALL